MIRKLRKKLLCLLAVLLIFTNFVPYVISEDNPVHASETINGLWSPDYYEYTTDLKIVARQTGSHQYLYIYDSREEAYGSSYKNPLLTIYYGTLDYVGGGNINMKIPSGDITTDFDYIFNGALYHDITKALNIQINFSIPTNTTWSNLLKIPRFVQALEILGYQTMDGKLITFYPNGGNGTMNIQGIKGTQTLTSNSFTKIGYTFKGWSTTSTGEVQYLNSATITPTGNTTLYAVWELNKFPVTINGGGTGVSGANSAQNYDSTVTIKAGTKPDYTFKNWTVNSGGAALANANSSTTTFTMPNSAVVLTANWNLKKPTKIVLSPTSQTVVEKMDLSIPTVTATYDNGTTGKVSATHNYDKENLTLGNRTVTYSYTYNGATVTATQTVNVISKSVSNIELSKTSGKIIEGMDIEIPTVTAVYNNATSANVTIETTNNYDKTDLVLGEREVIFTYNFYNPTTKSTETKTAIYKLTVISKSPTGITLSSPTQEVTEGMNLVLPTVTATYNNGTSQVVSATNNYNKEDITLGERDVVYTYVFNGKTVTATQKVNVIPKVLTSVEVSKQPLLNYVAGKQGFDDSGMELLLTYNNGTTEIVTGGWELSNTASDIANDNHIVTISFENKYGIQETFVEVSFSDTIISAEVNTPPNQISYVAGSEVDLSGMIVTATYDNGATYNHTEGFIISSEYSKFEGTRELDLTLDGVPFSQSFTWTKKDLASIQISSDPYKMSYIANEESINPQGLELTLVFTDGTIETRIYDDGSFLVYGEDYTEGIRDIKVEYTYKGTNSITKESYIKDVSFSGIVSKLEVVTPAAITSQVEGFPVKTDGLVLGVTYENGAYKEITNGFTIEPYDTNIGTREVPFTYGGVTTSTSYTWFEKSVVRITAEYKGGPLVKGQEIDKDVISVIAYYDNLTDARVSDFSINPIRVKRVGLNTIEIEHNGEIDYVSIVAKAVVSDGVVLLDVSEGDVNLVEDGYILDTGDLVNHDGDYIVTGESATNEVLVDNTKTNLYFEDTHSDNIKVVSGSAIYIHVNDSNMRVSQESVEVVKEIETPGTVTGSAITVTGSAIEYRYNFSGDDNSFEVTWDETSEIIFVINGYYMNLDTNGDGVPDINIDLDGDGNPDLNIDLDGDGTPDLNIDLDGDGKPDINIDIDGDRKPDLNIDLNGDGKPDLNIDLDGDGKPDLNIDLDGDGKADLNIDLDGDGKADLNIDLDADRKPDINIDLDGDGRPDLNIDLDGDGRPDINIDIDGDGKPDLNIDLDGDGKADINIDINGDGKADINIDINGDGIPDINIDTNGDGIPDFNIDINGDRIPDKNIDLNNNGILDSEENKVPDKPNKPNKPNTVTKNKADSNKKDLTTLYINRYTSDEKILLRKVLKTAKTENDYIIVSIFDETNKALDYQWKFRVSEINRFDDIDLTITKGKEKEGTLLLNFSHHGQLPSYPEIRMYVGEHYVDGETLDLYYYNDVSQESEVIKKQLVVKDGFITFTIKHCSYYFVTNGQADENPPVVKPAEPVITKPKKDKDKIVDKEVSSILDKEVSTILEKESFIVEEESTLEESKKEKATEKAKPTPENPKEEELEEEVIIVEHEDKNQLNLGSIIRWLIGLFICGGLISIVIRSRRK